MIHVADWIFSVAAIEKKSNDTGDEMTGREQCFSVIDQSSEPVEDRNMVTVTMVSSLSVDSPAIRTTCFAAPQHRLVKRNVVSLYLALLPPPPPLSPNALLRLVTRPAFGSSLIIVSLAYLALKISFLPICLRRMILAVGILYVCKIPVQAGSLPPA